MVIGVSEFFAPTSYRKRGPHIVLQGHIKARSSTCSLELPDIIDLIELQMVGSQFSLEFRGLVGLRGLWKQSKPCSMGISRSPPKKKRYSTI